MWLWRGAGRQRLRGPWIDLLVKTGRGDACGLLSRGGRGGCLGLRSRPYRLRWRGRDAGADQGRVRELVTSWGFISVGFFLLVYY